jgi:CxxC motif-containing protein (DUF1111 family)
MAARGVLSASFGVLRITFISSRPTAKPRTHVKLMRLAKTWHAIALGVVVIVGCGSQDDIGAQPAPVPVRPAKGLDLFDVPVPGIADELDAQFNDGDLLFSTPLREADGLGPLYTRSSCDSCHTDAVRGPGMVQKMSVVEADGVTPAIDQSMLAFGHTVHPLVVSSAAGELPTPILPPTGQSSVKVTARIGPPILGRGYMEAVSDSEIERVAAEQSARADAIHGRINRVAYASEPNIDTSFHEYAKGQTVIGRFGLKARVATLDDFTADAFQGDMGITSPLRPEEFPNPDGLMDDGKPGVDVDYRSVNLRATYVRLLAIPRRDESDAGATLFDATLCSVCHVPSLQTRADYPIAELAGVDAEVYTDFLLHRMSDQLADGMPADAIDGQAGSFEWRTSPLIGLRFNRTFLHDGRAKTIEEAVLAHQGQGSEANDSVARFDALSAADRATLLEFVQGL